MRDGLDPVTAEDGCPFAIDYPMRKGGGANGRMRLVPLRTVTTCLLLIVTYYIRLPAVCISAYGHVGVFVCFLNSILHRSNEECASLRPSHRCWLQRHLCWPRRLRPSLSKSARFKIQSSTIICKHTPKIVSTDSYICSLRLFSGLWSFVFFLVCISK